MPFLHLPTDTALDQVVDELTRRRLLGGGLALGGFAIAGCGSDDPRADESRPARTRSFTDATGDAVEIPQAPARIVSINDLLATRVLALGGSIVGLPTVGTDFRPEIADLFDLDDVTSLGPDPSVEAIAALEPDLILVGAYKGEVYEGNTPVAQLRTVAPVVVLETFNAVEEATGIAAELLGNAATTSVEVLRSDFDDALGELRDVLGESWSDVDTVVVRYDGPQAPLYVWAPTSVPPTDVIDRMGVRWLPEVGAAEENGGDLELSLEEVGSLDCDLMIIATAFQADDAPPPEELPVFAGLEAVRQGQVVKIDQSYFGVNYVTYSRLARKLAADIGRLGAIATDLV
jgi:iron complex transport system substrate-binding protein